ncbi:MAG: hypothetical protein R3F58_02585 [Steroidobacteraceae bacterium]
MEQVDRIDDTQVEEGWRARHPTLDAALRRAIHAPRLDRCFDASVWQRIQADDARLAAAVREAGASADVRLAFWMTVLNWVGVAVASVAAIAAVAPAIDAEVNVALVAGAGALVVGMWQLAPLRRVTRSLL